MKKFFYTIIFILLGINLNAQTVGERGISTDPRNPINPDINQPSLPVLNQLYWFKTNSVNPHFFNFTYNNGNNYQTNNITNPYYDILHYPFSATDPVSNTDFSDYWPEDGWEVVKVDFGRLANNVTSRQSISELAYIALYNRYNGVMRFMGALPNASSDAKNIRFNIRVFRKKEFKAFPTEFPKENSILYQKRFGYYDDDLVTTNLLSLHQEAMQPLDQMTSKVSTSVVTPFPGVYADYYFFWFDIPFAYDPCVCKGKLTLALSYEQLDTFNIDLKGSLVGDYKVQSSAEQADCHAQIPGQIIGGLIAGGKAIASSGTTVVSDIGSFSGLLNAAGCALGLTSKNQKTLKVFTDVVNATAVVVKGVNTISTNPGKAIKCEELEKDYYVSALANLDTIKKKDVIDLLSSSTKFLTTAYDLTTIDKAKEAKKAGGIQHNIQGAINLSGSATKIIENQRDILWALPGSSWGSQTLYEEVSQNSSGKLLPEYPMYNEAMGTFAFLKTPTLKLIKHSYDNTPLGDMYELHPDQVYVKYQTIFLDENLKYFFNPKTHVDLSNTVIMAGFESIGSFGDKYNSPMVNIDNLREVSFTYPNSSQNYKINLKIYIQFKSTDIGSKQEAVTNSQFFTIPVKINEIADLQYASEYDHIQNYSEQAFHPNWPIVQKLSSINSAGVVYLNTPINATQDVVIFSEEPIIVNTSIQSANGAKVYIKSTKSVEVGAVGDIGNMVFLEVDHDPYIEKWPQWPVSLQYVQDFCDKKSPEGIMYNADQYLNKTEEIVPTYPKFYWSPPVRIFPNPATESFNITSSAIDEIKVVQMFDNLGRLMFEWQDALKIYPLPFVANGNYIIKIEFKNMIAPVSKMLQINR